MKYLEGRHWLFLLFACSVAIIPPARAAHSDVPISAAADPCPVITTLTPFLDALPIPAVARPARTNATYTVPVSTNLVYAAVPEYDMPMRALQHKFHANLPPVEVWGYGGSYPGPSFDVVTDKPILVNWINQLPATYPSWLPINTNFHGVPDQSVRSVVHLHGGTSLPRFDGHPENWYRTGESDQYFYGNIDVDNDGQTQWYHDHAIGVTFNNVYAGLAGFYFLRNPSYEDPLNLPKGQFEIPLVFQDRDIQTNCSPASLVIVKFAGFLDIPWGHLPVVNGKVTPYLEVEPRRYRFRALNGAAFRTFGLNMFVSDLQGLPISGTAPAFNVIGTEDGFLKNPVTVSGTNSLILMSGERSDFIIDFTGRANSTFTVQNILPANEDVPLLGGPRFFTNLMQFRVTKALSSPDTSSIPGVLATNLHTVSSMLAEVVRTRNITLDMNDEAPFPGAPFEGPDIGGMPGALINMMFFHDPVTEFPHAGDTEIWNVINVTSESHPFHVHLTDFRLIDRRTFAGWNPADAKTAPASITNFVNNRISLTLQNITNYLSNAAVDLSPGEAYENGPKDSVRATAFSVTRIVMKWPTNSFYYNTPVGMPMAMSEHHIDPGTYVFHCHLLSHEDNDMMRPFQIVPPYQLPALEFTLQDSRVNPSPTGNNHFRLGFNARPNESYAIQSTSAANFQGWQDLPGGNIFGGAIGNFVEITPPVSVDSMRFYRVERKTP